MSAGWAMNGPPRLAFLYSEPKEHWLAPVEAAAKGWAAPAARKVVLPNWPWLALDWMLESVTYLLSQET